MLLFTAILFAQTENDTLLHILWVTLGNAFFFFGYAYITIFLLIPELLLKAKPFWFVIVFLLVGIGLSALKLLFSDYIFYTSIAPENMSANGAFNLRLILMNTKDMTFIVALFCIAKYVKDYILTENLRKKLEQQHRKAQSTLLQSQFDPHFMFNTINNLYALSLLNPTKTNEVISRMKIVLKYIIDESMKDFVRLEDEVALVENYLQLEKLRYGKRLQVSYKTEGNLHGAMIPPMILFMLVENSFKHGSSLDAGTPWIKILVKVEYDTIAIEIENSKPENLTKKTKEIEKGSGYAGLKKRLNIIYEKQGYTLKVKDLGDQFTVSLLLQNTDEDAYITYH
ncbi:histidine kinase [Draconibacterium sp. IB214405]|uniref:sensor histidine kinase n=1 Tax=Draconibacterium sp. IB214405 TaxID=3097352 RepID=UPI002A13BF84|nr:histidine kinase [Draconibacterium sp. IB214405]MDX8340218.1 histidine kinase [Draconibacterium sp. IB214405]